MKAIQARDLMVPLAEYPTVSEDATLYEGFLALDEARKKPEAGVYRYRAVLVQDKDSRIVGKLNLWDAIEGLEPGYKDLKRPIDASQFEEGSVYLKSMLEAEGLWREPLRDLCRKATQIYVREVMHVPGSAEYVEEDANLDEAIHRLLAGRYLSLLVTRGENVVGVLRVSDIFLAIYELAKACRI